MPSSALRARVRHVAAHSFLLSALAVAATAGASAASADTLPHGDAAAPAATTVGATAPVSASTTTARATAGRPVSDAVPSRTASKPTMKVLGMPAPASPDKAQNDDQMLAWTLKHSTAAERRDIARGLNVAYPNAVDLLGTTCDKGHGYVGLWVINFSAKTAHWNVTLDGAGYAGASVLPQSLDYGAIGVPNGPHTIAFVNPETGVVGDSLRTNLHCGAAAPVVVKPKPVVTKPVVTTPKPDVTKHAGPKPVVVKPAGTAPKPVVTRPVVSKPAAAPAATKTAHVSAARPVLGPKVQADFVAAPASQGLSPALVTVLLGAIGGSLVIARRFMRV